jgi:hypothetical protein
MLTPADKLANRRNDIIQILVTRTCDRDCPNCTQLLPFRKDSREMSLECFERACASLAGWPGVVALFGGNPCTHSRFPELCRILAEQFPEQRQRGLWTNNLLKYGAVARATFWPSGRFNLNAHGNPTAAADMRQWLPGIAVVGQEPSHHGAILLDRRDYGIGDTEWETLRECCDINQNWSAAIMERDGRPFAYFCEVAGALDGIRGENHGLPAEPGWWQWPIERFAEQVCQCCDRGCGVPLRGCGRLDDGDQYDVSPSLVSLLDIRSGSKITLAVHHERPPQTHELTDYLHRRL